MRTDGDLYGELRSVKSSGFMCISVVEPNRITCFF